MGNMPGHIPAAGGRGEEVPFPNRLSPCRVSVPRDEAAGGCGSTCGTGMVCPGPHGPRAGEVGVCKASGGNLIHWLWRRARSNHN